jgi:hypothetical protein
MKGRWEVVTEYRRSLPLVINRLPFRKLLALNNCSERRRREQHVRSNCLKLHRVQKSGDSAVPFCKYAIMRLIYVSAELINLNQ